VNSIKRANNDKAAWRKGVAQMWRGIVEEASNNAAANDNCHQTAPATDYGRGVAQQNAWLHLAGLVMHLAQNLVTWQATAAQTGRKWLWWVRNMKKEGWKNQKATARRRLGVWWLIK